MAAPTGYTQGQNGFFFKTSDGSGPFALGTDGIAYPLSGVGAAARSVTATIANGATTSDALDLGNARGVRISMPAAFTGVTLGITQLALDGVTYQTVYDSNGVAYTITVAASREIILNAVDFLGLTNIKLVSSAAEGAARTIGVFLQP